LLLQSIESIGFVFTFILRAESRLPLSRLLRLLLLLLVPALTSTPYRQAQDKGNKNYPNCRSLFRHHFDNSPFDSHSNNSHSNAEWTNSITTPAPVSPNFALVYWVFRGVFPSSARKGIRC